MAQRLEERHLADLHALAADLGVPRYRMLRRPELIREIEARTEPQRDRERLTEANVDATEEVRGILEITPQRHGFLLLRAVDLLAPLALGQRVLVEAAPRSGRTTLLRELANAIARTETAEVIVMLIDERPEEATAWQEAAPNAEVATATADLAAAEQVGIARLA